MSTNFPSSLDNFTNPASTDLMNSVTVPHNEQHANANDAIEALQAKVGVDSSAVTTSLDYKVAQLEAISHGKILQVVRATDTTQRSTTSTSDVDANISVTITPTSASSSIILIWSVLVSRNVASRSYARLKITDSSNVAISGTQDIFLEVDGVITYWKPFIIAYDSPATTSAKTYKGRFNAVGGGGTLYLQNAQSTGQLFAIEVGA
jgi:hypothetical protein